MNPPFTAFGISADGLRKQAAVRIAAAVPRELTISHARVAEASPAADAAEYLYLAVKRW